MPPSGPHCERRDHDGRFAAAHALMPPEQLANINAAILEDLLEEIPLDVAQQALIERAKRGDTGAHFPVGDGR